MIILKSRREIDKMKKSGQIVAEVLEGLKSLVVPGVSTLELDAYAANQAAKRGAKCAFKGYHNYPFSLCCSLNEQVVHGLPNSKSLIEGDIISLDFGVIYDGFYGDAAITLPVGCISANAKRLIDITEQSLYAAIDTVAADIRLGDVSFAVQSHVEGVGYSVVRDFVGHGIGRSLHEDPQIPNYGQCGKGVKLKTGMVLAIEPMINEKSHEVYVLNDNWTVVTADGGLSAHFEHTVAVTDNGPEILTKL